MRVVPADDASAVCYNMGSLQPFLMLLNQASWWSRSAARMNQADNHNSGFMLKLKGLLKNIVDDQIFGPVRALSYRIECQARGYSAALQLRIYVNTV